MGFKPSRARGCIRISLGMYNTDEEVDYVLKHLPFIIEKLREKSPEKTTGQTTTAEPASRAA